MDWLNQNSGIIVLITAILTIALLAFVIYLVFSLRSKIAVQRLKFLGFYSTDVNSRANFAEFTVGNKSLNDVGISEIGIKNGKVAFNLTELFKAKKGMKKDARIVLEQRSSISFRLTADELKKVLVDGKNGKKVLNTLRVYAVDLTGTLYQGKVPAVRKLLADLVAAEKRGDVPAEVVHTEQPFVEDEEPVEPVLKAPDAAAQEMPEPPLETTAEKEPVELIED